MQIQLIHGGVIQDGMIDIPHAHTLRDVAATYERVSRYMSNGWDHEVYVPHIAAIITVQALYNIITEHTRALLT